MADSQNDMIEIKKIYTSDGKNKIEREVMLISEIKSFRNWKKTAKEADVEGPITLVVLVAETIKEGKKKNKTMLINEDFDSFSSRMGSRVVIR